mgnify:FL=1
MNKRTWAVVDIDALKQNYNLARSLVGVRVMPVIKADAYGHGAVLCAEALCEAGADALSVSCVDEAIELRRAGIRAELLILGYTAPESFSVLLEDRITQTVMSVEYARALSDFARARGERARAQIKLDTGMGRLGLFDREDWAAQDCAKEVLEICALEGLSVGGIFTHFASSDVAGDDFTQQQADRFQKTVRLAEEAGAILPVKHCSNSGAILNCPQLHADLVREGIMLYGYTPDPSCPDPGLRPVMELKSVLAFRSVLRAGETVSYGRTFRAERDLPIGVVPVGYADGYPRALSNRAWVTIGGKKCPIVGRVCMDQMMVDLSEAPDAPVGAEVTLFGGDGPSCPELAELAGTIHYELLCALAARVPHLYLRGGKIVEERSRIV